LLVCSAGELFIPAFHGLPVDSKSNGLGFNYINEFFGAINFNPFLGRVDENKQTMERICTAGEVHRNIADVLRTDCHAIAYHTTIDTTVFQGVLNQWKSQTPSKTGLQ
jgi:hypothetical protein